MTISVTIWVKAKEYSWYVDLLKKEKLLSVCADELRPDKRGLLSSAKLVREETENTTKEPAPTN
jgi:hypothetical protein